MAQLAKGLNATGIVLEVEEAFDSFQDTKSDKPGTRYCHKFTIEVDGEHYICQVCTTYQKLVEFGVDDELHFNVKSFSKDIHTIGIISVRKSIVARNGLSLDIPKEVPVLGHINMAGTPEAIALQASVNYHCYRTESTLLSITETATELCKWLRTEYYLNTQS